MKWLDQELIAYGKTRAYPMHMPGHKRISNQALDPYQIDITEIDGFDNLHHPEGIIADLLEQMSLAYHCPHAYLLVNGSTVGNLSAIMAATEPGDEIIVARNSHKSVYNACYLQRLKVSYVFPKILDSGILGPVEADPLRQALEDHPKARAVVITSPTYEGISSNLKELAQICHEAGAVLIVDGAHGAHFGFHPYFPKSMMDSGADAITMSLHKTLPAFTQTAAFFLPEGSRLDRKKCENYLSMLQTSSPSYILMAQAARCIRMLTDQSQAFETYAEMLKDFYEKTADLTYLHILREPGMDPSKIVIMTTGTDMSGEDLMEALRDRYQIELEMCGFDYGLAMTSVNDTKEGLDRLAQALMELDGERRKAEQRNISNGLLYTPKEKVVEPYETKLAASRTIPLEEGEGQVASQAVIIYPPGIPIVNAGERITKEVIDYVKEAQVIGLNVIGADQNIEVLA